MLTLLSLRNALLAGAVYAALSFLAPVSSAARPSYTYDTTSYETMAKQALTLVATGDLKGALKEMKDVERKWDSETGDLKKADSALWTTIDKQMDVALGALKKTDAKKATDELNNYLEQLARVPQPEKR